MDSLVIDGCAVATMDAAGAEYTRGHLVLAGGRITAAGDGPAPAVPGARVVDGSGCLATPGLVNSHHHLWQWLTRGQAQGSGLFDWLAELYPRWRHLDADLHRAAARAALAMLALSGCTASADHHYLFPRGPAGRSPGPAGFPRGSGDLLAAGIEAAGEIGLRFHACRGSMDLGTSAGGLPPDEVVEDTDAALAATDEAIRRFHDPAPDAMVRVAVAPCAPFTVTGELMRASAELARRHGVRLHTHLAETADEHEYCQQRFGCSPAQYLESLGWLGRDVWVAHGVHLRDAEVALLARAGTGVAHCPSSNGRLGSGIAPVPELLAAGVPVGLGVDGAAGNEHGGLAAELRQALLMARARRGAGALTTRQVLAAATVGGARCLGRAGEIGSLEAGKLADVALWRLDGLGHAGAADPVAALVLGPPAPLELLTVGGRPVVDGGELVTADVAGLAHQARVAAGELRRRCE
ncbi:MAG: 8-oxoguanine deaminase [Actinobacteria bacterium]|nr:8-oxoguanine deaminase [Actinomycetota bacterium]